MADQVRDLWKSSQKDSARRMPVLAGFLTVFDALRICWTSRQKVFNIFSIFNIFNIFNIFCWIQGCDFGWEAKLAFEHLCGCQEMLKMLKMLKTFLKTSE